MNLKTLMVIKAVVCLTLGVPILLVPGAFYGLFGVTLGAGGMFAAREYGASLMGNLMVTWFARNAAASQARWAIILGLFLYDAIGFVITLIPTITGEFNALAWFPVAIYLFFALGYGYFLLYSPRTETRTRTA